MKTDLELNENEAVFFDAETLQIVAYIIYSEFNHDWFSVDLNKLRPERVVMLKNKIEDHVAANSPEDARADLDLDAMRDEQFNDFKNIFKPGDDT